MTDRYIKKDNRKRENVSETGCGYVETYVAAERSLTQTFVL